MYVSVVKLKQYAINKYAAYAPRAPANIKQRVARLSYFPYLTNLNTDTFIKNAHDPIMIGKAVDTFIPKIATRAIHGE